MIRPIPIIIGLILCTNRLYVQENNTIDADKKEAVELLSQLLNDQKSLLPQEIQLKIKKELFGECYLDGDDMLWGLKIVPSCKNNENKYDQQICNRQNQALQSQAAYWHALKRRKEILCKVGIFYDSYFFRGEFVAKNPGTVMGIGPNRNGFVIIKNNDSWGLILKNKTDLTGSWHTPSEKISIDTTNTYGKCCMHHSKNKWATALIKNNILQVAFNTYNKLIISTHTAFECDDEEVQSLHYDYTDTQDSLLLLTNVALYRVSKSLQKLLSLESIVNEHVDTKWTQHISGYTCSYECSQDNPWYFVLRVHKKYVHPEPHETYSLLFKRSNDRAVCKLVFNKKVGFLQPASLVDRLYNLRNAIKIPKRLLVLRSADEVIENAIKTIK